MSKPQYRTCRYLHADGMVCGSPALKGELYCYYHQRDRQRAKILNAENTRRIARLTPRVLDALNLPSPDDPASIRVCIATLMRGILAGLVDKRQAGQVLYLIQLALLNFKTDDTWEDHVHLRAITDPEPIRLPKLGPDEEQVETSDSASDTAAAAELEVVMVQPRSEASNNLMPNMCYEPRTLDAIDEQYFTLPKAEPQERSPDEPTGHAAELSDV